MTEYEAPVVKNVMMEATRRGLRLLRNNRGMFYTLDKKRKVRAGLECDGASDLIGITPVVITEAMIGLTIGVFTAVEVKKLGWTFSGRGSEIEQNAFIKETIKKGGFGFFIDNHEDLSKKIADCLKNMLDSHLKHV